MDSEQPSSYTAPGLRLRGAFGVFARQANPRVIGAMLVSALALRVLLARWTVGDALVALAIVALEPFTEWLTHVTVLHLRPIIVRGRTVELHIARRHRLHHYKNEKYWFGVTVHLADHVLRTFPQRDAVETSPTARTLAPAGTAAP